MRIDSLRLLAFGPFTDVELDFAGPGLQIVFGENGAGKSTALRALHGLLFGIHARTTDAWLHDMPELRVGGRISDGTGTALDLVRRKGNKNTLRDAAGDLIDEAVLTRLLSGASASLHESMFGLDQRRLRTGGEDLLHGHGDVGTALFGAAAGSSAVHALLASLERDAGELFVPRGRNQRVNAAIHEYERESKAARELSVSSQDWKDHHDALADAEARQMTLDGEIQQLESRRSRAERLLSVLGPLAERTELRAELDTLADVPELAKDAPEQRRTALADLERATNDLRRAADAIDGHRAEIETIDAPAALLGHQDEITELSKRIGQVRKGARDLPGLHRQLESEMREALAALHEVDPALTLEDAEQRRVTRAVRTALQDLAERRPKLDEAVSVARAAREQTGSELADRCRLLARLPEVRDHEPLRNAVAEARDKGDLERQIGEQRAELAAAESSTRDLHRELGLVPADLATVLALDVPLAATVDRFVELFAAGARELETITTESEKTRRELARTQTALDELERSGAVPTELELNEDRARRETIWQAVRAAWLDGDPEPGRALEQPLPDAYEAGVAAADRTADRLRAEADRVAKKAQLLAARDAAERERKLLAGRLSEQDRSIAERDQNWGAAWTAAAIDPLSPAEMREWLSGHKELRAAAQAARDAADRLESLQATAAHHRASLELAIIELGEAASPEHDGLGAVLRRAGKLAEDLAGSNRDRRTAEAEIDRLERLVLEQDDGLTRAQRELDAWQSDWARVAGELRLPQGATINQGLAVLSAIDAALGQVTTAAGTHRRISGIERDAEDFDTDARRLLDEIVPGGRATDLASEIEAVQVRAGAAERGQVQIASIRTQIEENEQQLADAQARAEDAQTRLDLLVREARATGHEQLQLIETRSARKSECERELRELERRISELGTDSVDSLEGAAEGQDPDVLGAEIATLSRRLKDLVAERLQLSELVGHEKAELKRIDGSAAAAEAGERAQSALADARDGAERHMQLKLAAILLRRAIEAYRKTSQAPVLTRANELLPRLTLNVIAGLQTDFDDRDEPVLRAVKGGGPVDVANLSDGERDALHLALRVATLEHYFASSPAVPLILDDLLLNFDDDRARAGFGVLHELTKLTQVVFFTHHEHLVALAQDVIPAAELAITRLPVVAAGRT